MADETLANLVEAERQRTKPKRPPSERQLQKRRLNDWEDTLTGVWRYAHHATEDELRWLAQDRPVPTAEELAELETLHHELGQRDLDEELFRRKLRQLHETAGRIRKMGLPVPPALVELIEQQETCLTLAGRMREARSPKPEKP